MYEDQRSTVLAVDNMNGAQVLGRTIRVSNQFLTVLKLFRHWTDLDVGGPL